MLAVRSLSCTSLAFFHRLLLRSCRAGVFCTLFWREVAQGGSPVRGYDSLQFSYLLCCAHAARAPTFRYSAESRQRANQGEDHSAAPPPGPPLGSIIQRPPAHRRKVVKSGTSKAAGATASPEGSKTGFGTHCLHLTDYHSGFCRLCIVHCALCIPYSLLPTFCIEHFA